MGGPRSFSMGAKFSQVVYVVYVVYVYIQLMKQHIP